MTSKKDGNYLCNWILSESRGKKKKGRKKEEKLDSRIRKEETRLGKI